MLIIGERINTSRKRIEKAVREKDEVFIRAEIKKQIEAGAEMVDLNAGQQGEGEVENLKWLFEVAQAEGVAKVCLDSSNPQAIKEVISLGRERETLLINSTTAEVEKMALIFPLVKEYHCQLVGLCLDETGIPSSVEQRLVSARKIIKEAEKFKIPPHKIYLDPLIYPISTSTQQGIMVIETLKKIKQDFPGVKTIVGLSNISYGLPGRKIINRAFLSMLLLTNLDAALIDPLDTELMAELKAGLALLNQDEFCLNYLQFFRQQIAGKGG